MASIDQLPSEAWRVRWQPGNMSLTFDGEDEALQAKVLIEAGMRDKAAVFCTVTGTPLPEKADGDRRTVEQLVPDYLASLLEVDPRTRNDNRGRLERAAFPVIGKKPAADVRWPHISEIMAAVSARVSKKTADRYYNTLKGFFSYCVKAGIRADNPVKDIAWKPIGLRGYHKTRKEDEHFYMTKAQVEILRAGFGPKDQLLIDFLYDTGCRWGEAAAVELRQIRRQHGRWLLDITQAWKDDRGEAGWYLGEPKAGSYRTIALSLGIMKKISPLLADRRPRDRLFAHLPDGAGAYSEMRYRWERGVTAAMRCDLHPPLPEGEELEGRGTRCGDHGGVNDKGKSCRQWVTPGWNRCTKHVGVRPHAVSVCACWERRLPRRPKIHDLRHSHVARLIEAGVPLKAIAARLGHASTDVTEQVYAGLLPDIDDRILAALDDGEERLLTVA